MRPLHFIGFDPGGNNAFGWAVLSQVHGRTSLTACGTCSNAPEALTSVRLKSAVTPDAFAVDAPLFWIPAGDRNADKLVRKMVCAAGGSSGTVSHVNSLRGACLVQGILVTQMAAKAWPEALISEAHPKALLLVNSAAREFAINIAPHTSTEHERDAALAAFTALEFFSTSAGWHDLAKSDGDHCFPTGRLVSYWFPQSAT